MPKGEYLQYGGQAVIEGVMMRSPHFFSIACRAPNGEIVQTTEPLEKTWIGRQKWLKLPFLRGSWALLDAMTLGVKAMRFATNVQLAQQYQLPTAEPVTQATPKPKWQRILQAVLLLVVGIVLLALAFPDATSRLIGVAIPHLGPAWAGRVFALIGVLMAFVGLVGLISALMNKESEVIEKQVQDITIGGTIVVSLMFGLFLFNYVPNMLAEQLRFAGVTNGTLINLATECVKAVFFVGYLWLIGQMKEVGEVFKYHGAEHKAINTLEADHDLSMEHCTLQTRLHPRCGTSFAIIVLLLSFLIAPLVPRYLITGHQGNWLIDVTARFVLEVLVILPVIAGVAYELIRFAGKFRNTAFVNLMFKPGLMSQYLTTREPEEDKIAVALAALKACIDAENAREA